MVSTFTAGPAWLKFSGMTTHAPFLCRHWVDRTGERSGCRRRLWYKFLQHLMWLIGGSQHMHTDIAPFPYFPFRSPGDSLGHLLWDTSPLSSLLCPLTLAFTAAVLGRVFVLCVGTKANKKPGIKGGCQGGLISAKHWLDTTQPSSWVTALCASSHWGKLTNNTAVWVRGQGDCKGGQDPAAPHRTAWQASACSCICIYTDTFLWKYLKLCLCITHRICTCHRYK